MENQHLIRENLDIKLLILYVLDKMTVPVKPMLLQELLSLDDGFGWFEYSACLTGLIETGNAAEKDGKYVITEKGHQNINLVYTSLPDSILKRADQLAVTINRNSMIETSLEPGPDGGKTVSLSLADGLGEIIAIRLLVPDETLAEEIEDKFRRRAEEIYNRILEIFIEPEES